VVILDVGNVGRGRRVIKPRSLPVLIKAGYVYSNSQKTAELHLILLLVMVKFNY
jgi:hypothetical protein